MDPRVFQREPKDAPRVPIEGPKERKKQVYQNVLFDTPALEDPKVPRVDPRVPQEDQKGPRTRVAPLCGLLGDRYLL